jgi:hypothetical protein
MGGFNFNRTSAYHPLSFRYGRLRSGRADSSKPAPVWALNEYALHPFKEMRFEKRLRWRKQTHVYGLYVKPLLYEGFEGKGFAFSKSTICQQRRCVNNFITIIC